MADPLPQILAGPILRRTDATGAWVWVATSQAVTVSGSVYDAAQSLNGLAGLTQLATGTASSLPFGTSLHIVVVGMLPPSGSALPKGKLLGYNLQFNASGTLFQLSDIPELLGDVTELK